MALLIQHHSGEGDVNTVGVILESADDNVDALVERAIRNDVTKWVCPPQSEYTLRREDFTNLKTTSYMIFLDHDEATDNDGVYVISEVPVL